MSKPSDLPHCCYPDADFRPMECVELMAGPKVNTAPFGAMPPGTVKIGKPVPNPEGGWTVPFEYRAQGWKDAEEQS